MVASIPTLGTPVPESLPSARAHGPALELESVRLERAGTCVLDGVSLRVEAGEQVAVFGPTGAGKTTLLRVIAGLLEPNAGEVRIGGRTVCGRGPAEPPHRRGVAMVFQGLALWPNLTVFEHAFEAARARGLDEAAARDEANAAIAAVALEPLAGERPARLSGGERQRLAMARALAAKPHLLLLDEPFANIDRPARDLMIRRLDALRRESGSAVVWVTHDVHEGLEGSGRVAILRAGRIEQVGSPCEVFAAPVSRFTAACVGFSAFLPALRVSAGEVETRWGRFVVAGGAEGDGDGFLALRPRALARDESSPLRGMVASCGFRDGAYLARVQVDGADLVCAVPEPLAPGMEVGVRISGCGVFVRA